ncbi:DUF418 domain-containing protein [Sphingomonas aracearum]|uniref:DUF418 domain-containing protein n=1 Tax=Sphingomonas aracearum TaxID=2283317 RepID=A0A369VWP3_9SPHN|nr:DUF418 domain-containing protein [Sphingomonas aracearum]RDE06259.1 DUF418 domain-containing protein [Sphingomonas aracearum]
MTEPSEAGAGSLPGSLAPVAPHERIVQLDMLRGLAILAILFMNIPQMAAPLAGIFGDGWSAADFRVFAIVHLLVDGTQRGLLELLFGAGTLLLTARVMAPGDPVAVADVYFRRNLWLLVFGLANVFVLLWFGDILFIYALAALFLFSFRRVRPGWLLAMGLVFAAYTSWDGGSRYLERRALYATVTTAQAHRAAGVPLTAAERAALGQWQELRDAYTPGEGAKRMLERELTARRSGVIAYARFHWDLWLDNTLNGGLARYVMEAFCTMLIGMALWKWGVTQGRRSTAFYLAVMVAGYGFGLAVRGWNLPTMLAREPGPVIELMLDEPARLAVTLGHLALVTLALRTAVGRAMLAPLRAAGQAAFSIYLLQALICLWVLFAPWSPAELWGRYHWLGWAMMALAVNGVLLLAANLWLRAFAIGPLEWLWRWLTYGERPVLRRTHSWA